MPEKKTHTITHSTYGHQVSVKCQDRGLADKIEEQIRFLIWWNLLVEKRDQIIDTKPFNQQQFQMFYIC